MTIIDRVPVTDSRAPLRCQNHQGTAGTEPSKGSSAGEPGKRHQKLAGEPAADIVLLTHLLPPGHGLEGSGTHEGDHRERCEQYE